jgi:alanine dehydrogenase
MRTDAALALGLNTHEGMLTNAPVAQAHGYDVVAVQDVVG